MPLKFDIKKKLHIRCDRVKSVEFHPTEPWILSTLYTGNVTIWSLETLNLIKSFESSKHPVRTAKFIIKKNLVATGSDDAKIRLFNYNTLEKVRQFEAHSDFIRCIEVHPSQPFLLTCGDDKLIKLWNWDMNWICAQVFEGHSNYVMQIAINPKYNNTFASASLDKTIKIWNLGSKVANFTMEGHEKGVNCLGYYSGADKPYLVSGGDDCLIKIWDYHTKTCVQTLNSHVKNISSTVFHPELPLIITGSEDGIVRMWNSNTYSLENTLNYGMERVWNIATLKESNYVAVAYDEGAIVLKLGREEPAISMDRSGKIIFARNTNLMQVNIKSLGDELTDIQDGCRIPLVPKELGSTEIYPQTIAHNSNGKFVVVTGGGEYAVYTAMTLRSKVFGRALDFVWSSSDPNKYAIRDSTGIIKIFKSFKETRMFKAEFGVEVIFGGQLLSILSLSGLSFYDWESAQLVRRIDVSAKGVYWSDSGLMVAIVTEEALHLLRYDPEAIGGHLDEDGIQGAFEVTATVDTPDLVTNGTWVGDCFLYTSEAGRLQYTVGGEVVMLTDLGTRTHLLGLVAGRGRVLLAGRGLEVVGYGLDLPLLEYQALVAGGRDPALACHLLAAIARESLPRLVDFLERRGHLEEALAVCGDPGHKVQLALRLDRPQLAFELLQEDGGGDCWQQVAEAAMKACDFGLARECLGRARDYGGILLLATSTGDRSSLEWLAGVAAEAGQDHIAFLSLFLLHDLHKCLQILIDKDRLSEAGFFARAYLPSRIEEVVRLWKDSLLRKDQPKIADALAFPSEYSNLFPGFERMIEIEAKMEAASLRGASEAAEKYGGFLHCWDAEKIKETEGVPFQVEDKYEVEETPRTNGVSCQVEYQSE